MINDTTHAGDNVASCTTSMIDIIIPEGIREAEEGVFLKEVFHLKGGD